MFAVALTETEVSKRKSALLQHYYAETSVIGKPQTIGEAKELATLWGKIDSLYSGNYARLSDEDRMVQAMELLN